jgi:prepilin-type N-terminal cleavage/methylation domain-containing protein
MKPFKNAGFTLIELLTVIAVIAILAAMGATVGPRMIERSKWTHFKTTCNQLKNSCSLYATKDAVKSKTTFPPAYGYRTPRTSNDIEEQCYIYKPYLAYIEQFGDEQWYDKFQASSYDTDHDGKISLLEFQPLGTKQPTGGYVFATPFEPDNQPLYNGSNLKGEVDRMKTAHRPYVYIPVNAAQAEKAKKYWLERVMKVSGRELEGANAERWLPDETFSNVASGEANNPIASLTEERFPPAKYDDFVLISPGPSETTGGILTAGEEFMNDISGYSLTIQYHILALRAFCLATRDLNGNGKFDFDYRNRTRGDDGKAASYSNPAYYKLPDGTGAQGPGIYECNYPDGA